MNKCATMHVSVKLGIQYSLDAMWCCNMALHRNVYHTSRQLCISVPYYMMPVKTHSSNYSFPLRSNNCYGDYRPKSHKFVNQANDDVNFVLLTLEVCKQKNIGMNTMRSEIKKKLKIAKKYMRIHYIFCMHISDSN